MLGNMSKCCVLSATFDGDIGQHHARHFAYRLNVSESSTTPVRICESRTLAFLVLVVLSAVTDGEEGAGIRCVFVILAVVFAEQE